VTRSLRVLKPSELVEELRACLQRSGSRVRRNVHAVHRRTSFNRTTTNSLPRSLNPSRISLPAARCDGLIPLSGVERKWLAGCRGRRLRLRKLSAEEPGERGEEVMWRGTLSRCPAGSDCAGIHSACAHHAHYERTIICGCGTLRRHATTRCRTAPA
jgi:hypothetical protein